jgi:hypothetical protein
MMTIQEIEAACGKSQQLDFSRHTIEVYDLPLKKTFYPLGFPVDVRTNSSEVLELQQEAWGAFDQRHDTAPIIAEVHVVEDGSTECPPKPTHRIMLPFITAIADGNNYTIVDLERNRTYTSISRATLRYPLYAKHVFLGSPACCIATRYATPIHGGCVSLDGRGVLLCGDSGAGKSTLSYACARAGWTFTSDDGSYLTNNHNAFQVTGEYYKVRFRPTAADLFSEIQGLELTPRMEGKPSIELPTINVTPHIKCAQTAQVNFIVFLNRHAGGPPALLPYCKTVARYAMRQTLYGLPETRALQYAMIERLLELDVLELRYTDLDWAIERLQKLVQEGR